MKEEYPQRELSAQIIGAAMKVLNDLKPGLDEKIYENALVIELVAQGHGVEQQRGFPVHYRGHLVGTLIPDILVDGKIIVDPKVVAAFSDDHLAQMLGYVAITDLELALLLNFRFAKLQWKRVIRSRPTMYSETATQIAQTGAMAKFLALEYVRPSASSAVRSVQNG